MSPLDSLRHRTGRADSPVVGSDKSRKMYYVYVLRSEKDGDFYVGFTCDLDRRLKEHNDGENLSTSYRRPFILVYFEVCFDGRDAIHREKYLKSSWGKRYIKGRIKGYLSPLDSLRHRTGRAPLDSLRHRTGRAPLDKGRTGQALLDTKDQTGQVLLDTKDQTGQALLDTKDQTGQVEVRYE